MMRYAYIFLIVLAVPPLFNVPVFRPPIAGVVISVCDVTLYASPKSTFE